MKRLLVILITFAVMSSCDVDIPSGIISKSKMTNLLYDYHMAQQMANVMEGDVDKQRYVLIHKVFEKYGVTESEFDSSMVWYSGNSMYLVDIYADIDARMKREMKQLGLDDVIDEYANLSETGDTARIWSRTNLWLKNNMRENILSFNIKSDSTFLLGDTYLLRFNNKFISTENRRESYAMISARYDNDSVSSQAIRVGGNHETKLHIHENELTRKHALKYLSITFYLNYEPNSPKCLWMVSKPTLIRFHNRMEEKAKTDSLATDSLQMVAQDTLSVDSQRVDTVQRATPRDLRQEHKGERNIHVIKKRDVTLPPAGAQPMRRKR